MNGVGAGNSNESDHLRRLDHAIRHGGERGVTTGRLMHVVMIVELSPFDPPKT
jgi:hypothetical protein